ncbi:MAG: methyltransferase [Acidobacteriota bacterium]
MESHAAKTGPTPERIMQLGLGYWGSKTFLSAVELGLFSELSGGALDAEALRRRLGLHARSAGDFFDALVALGVLERNEGRYSNTEETALFLVRDKPTYVGGMLEMAGRRLFPFWASLTEALRTGQPQNEIKGGTNLFETLYSDPARLEQFASAMTGISLGAAMTIAEKFPWEKYKTFIDIGAAQGGLAVQVALRHKHLSGGGFDLPVLQPIFEKYAAVHGVGDRLRFHAGDFFKDPLPKVDVLVMGHILHDWNLEEKMKLLRKAFEALPVGGALVVYEALIDDERRHNAFGLLMSLNMLIETPGGFDYTGADCSGWMRQAGFSQTRVEHLVGPDSMVVGIK